MRHPNSSIKNNQTQNFTNYKLQLVNEIKIILLIGFAIALASIAGNSTTISLETTDLIANSKPQFEQVSICRLQVKIKTNGIENANTDSPVWVQMNMDDQPYFLNLSKNDREKNKIDVYDVLSPNINKIKDIQFLKIGIKGNDGWNIREISLIVNEVLIFKQAYSSKGVWLDNDNSKYHNALTFKRTTLRKYPNFKYNNITANIWKAPSLLPKDYLTALVESAVGNSLYFAKDIQWGKKQGNSYISSKRINDNTLRFDLDLSYDVTGPNPEVDVDFDLVFSCENGIVRTKITNFKSKATGVYPYLKSTLKKLRGVLLESCGKAPVPGSTIACQYGLDKIDKLLDFNFNYEGPNVSSYAKSCSGDLKLDSGGNLVVTSKKSTNPRQQTFTSFTKMKMVAPKK